MNIFFKKKKKSVTWLSMLEDYISTKYQPLLNENNLVRVSSKEGIGMGALITFSNTLIEIDLINDRCQFFIDARSIEFPKSTYDQAVLFVVSKLFKDKRTFTSLAENEKILLYETSYDFSDPFKFFFDIYEDILLVLNEKNINNSITEAENFLDGRVRWSFPKMFNNVSSKP